MHILRNISRRQPDNKIWSVNRIYRIPFVVYKGDCSCGSRYIGETKRNAEVRWNEHNNPTKSSEPSKHLRSNINHYFTWAVISNAPKNAKTRKNLESSYIDVWKPDLSEQKNFKRLVLFRNGVT